MLESLLERSLERKEGKSEGGKETNVLLNAVRTIHISTHLTFTKIICVGGIIARLQDEESASKGKLAQC